MANKNDQVSQAAQKAQTQWVRTLKVLGKLAESHTLAVLTVTGKTDTHSWKLVIENHENGLQQFRICIYVKSIHSNITAIGEYKWNEKPNTESLREHFRAVSRMDGETRDF